MARVQTPELRADIALRPAPIQSDTYAPPPRPSADNRLGQLADALSSFSSSLGGLMTQPEPTAEDKQNLQWQAERKFSGRTREDWVQAVETGQIPAHANEFEQRAIMATSGFEFGSHRAAQLQQDLSTNFDWDNGDVDAYISQAISADLEKYGEDRNFGTQYLRSMDSLRSWAMEYREKRKNETHVELQNRAAFGFIDTFVDKGIKAGSDPEQIAAVVYGEYQNLGKDGTLGVDYKQLDQEMLNKARRIAGSHPEVALALLTHERVGSDGSKRSLVDNPSMRDTVLGIQATAAAAFTSRDEALQLDQLAAQDYELFREGNGDAINQPHVYTTLDGKEKRVSVEERKERAKRMYQESSERVAELNREQPSDRLERETRDYHLSGEKHPQLETALDNLSGAASLDLLQDPAGRTKVIQKLETYKWAVETGTNVALTYTSEEDRSFGDAYLMAQKYLGQDQETALTTAIRAQQLTKAGLPRLSQQDNAKLESALGRIVERDWKWDTEAANYSIVEQKVRQQATLYMQLGLKPENAVKAAAGNVQQSSFVYNGVLLDLQGFPIPEDMKETLDLALDDFVQENPLLLEQANLERRDLTVVPAGGGSGVSGGRLLLVDKTTMLPVLDDNGRQSMITLGKLRKDSHTRKVTKQTEIAREQVLRNSIKQRNLFERDTPDGPVWVDRETGEVYKYEFGEDAVKPKWSKTGKRFSKHRRRGFQPE